MNYTDSNLKYVRAGENKYILFLNRTPASWVEKHEEQDETIQGYHYDEVTVEAATADRNALISALIHTEYDINKEISLLRQKEVKIDEFQGYSDFADSCKIKIDEMLNR